MPDTLLESKNYSFMGNMSEEELLNQMEIDLEAMTDLDYDDHLIDAYLDALEKAAPLEINIDVDASLNEFHTLHESPVEKPFKTNSEVEKRAGKKIFTMRLIVAVILGCTIFGSIVGQAIGIDVWNIIVSWTKETFSFQTTPDVENNPVGKTTYSSLEKAIDDLGLGENLYPNNTLNFMLTNVSVFSDADMIKINADYTCGEKYMLISIRHYLSGEVSTSVIFEKQFDEPAEIYSWKGVNHYIVSNTDQMTATWIYGSNLISITGNLSKEEIKEIIISFYES